MNLFDFNIESGNLTIAPEALTLIPFKKVWESNKDKKKSIKELAYVYYMASKSNELVFWQIEDEGVRSEEVITFVFGENSKYKPSVHVIEALDFYKEKVNPYSAGLLESALKGAFTAKQYIEQADWALKDNSGKFVYDVNKLRDLFLKLPDFDDVIQTLRKKIRQEEQEDGNKKRGQRSIGMYEGGVDDV